MRAQSVLLRARAQPVKAAHGRVRKRRRGFRGRAHQRSAECNRRGRRQRTAKRASRERRRTRYREHRDRAARTFAKRRGRPFAVKDDGFERLHRERRERGERSSRRGFEQSLVSGTRLSGPLGPPARVVGGRVARVAGSGLRERVRRGSRLSVFERARSDAHLFRVWVVRAPQRLERLHRYRPRVQLGERQLGLGVGVAAIIVPLVAGHGAMVTPRSRNSIDFDENVSHFPASGGGDNWAWCTNSDSVALLRFRICRRTRSLSCDTPPMTPR
mgnify:CR=1 FL=1